MKTVPRSSALLAAAFAAACGNDDVGNPDPGNPSFDLTCNIPVDEIFSGGVSRDGIPAISNPDIGQPGVIPAGLLAEDRALGVVVDGEARAYPFPVMWYHEVVNDTLGGLPVLVSYCPLTGTGIVFDRRIDGLARDFGVSGVLYRSNLIMFDRETETLWTQMIMGSSCGLDRGKELTRLPVVETTIGHWLDLYPDATVMTVNTGFQRNYDVYPYADYANLDNEQVSFLASGVTFSRRRPAKDLVLGVFTGWNNGQCIAAAGCRATAYPLAELDSIGVGAAVNDSVGDLPVLVAWVGARQTARAWDRRVDGELLTFDAVTNLPLTMTDRETGSVWNELGEATDGPLAGSQLTPITDSYVGFWFAWSLYFRSTNLFLAP